MPCAETMLPRQLVLGSFSWSLQTTRATDDAVMMAAIGRMFELPGFTSLTRSIQEVLIALIAKRNFKQPTEIHHSAYNQSYVALSAGVSRSTVKRAYAIFDSMGWIERGEQAYDTRHKRYEGTPISFSNSFVEALNLNQTFDAAVKEMTPRAPQSIFPSNPENICAPVAQNEPLIKEDSFVQSLQRQSPVRRVEGQKPVPRELFCLIEKGLTSRQVFWLMGLASKSGKWLSDIVEFKHTAIMKRQGRMLIGFLKTLIGENVDYASRIRELKTVAEEQAVVHKAECELDGLADKVMYIDGDGQGVHIRRLSSGFNGELAGGRGSIPHGELLKLARAGRLKNRSTQTIDAGVLKEDVTPEIPINREVARDAMSKIRSLIGIRSINAGIPG